MEEIEVIYESSDYIVLNKPSGVLMHDICVKQNKEEKGFTLADWAINRYPEIKTVGDNPRVRPGMVHRIDKETSGIIIMARNQRYFDFLKNLFADKKISKKYIALVHGVLKENEGVITKPIGIKNGTVKRTVYGGKMVKEAETYFKVLKRYNNYSLLEIIPKTGRTHQIRVHLASIGHPVAGDKLYGGKKEKKSLIKMNRHFLHALELKFESVPGELVVFKAPVPKYLTRVLKSI